MTDKKLAIYVKDQRTPSGAFQCLYRLDPPLEDGTTYVVVSAVHASYSGPETYIFPSDAEGNITDWGELPGSYRGGLDHVQALTNLGYDVGWPTA